MYRYLLVYFLIASYKLLLFAPQKKKIKLQCTQKRALKCKNRCWCMSKHKLIFYLDGKEHIVHFTVKIKVLSSCYQHQCHQWTESSYWIDLLNMLVRWIYPNLKYKHTEMKVAPAVSYFKQYCRNKSLPWCKLWYGVQCRLQAELFHVPCFCALNAPDNSGIVDSFWDWKMQQHDPLPPYFHTRLPGRRSCILGDARCLSFPQVTHSEVSLYLHPLNIDNTSRGNWL